MTNPTHKFTIAAELPPSLDSGQYHLELSQDASAGETSGSYQRTYAFTVAGPRFSLDPTIVHSRYPTPNGVGAYAEYLPQVVLTQASLPWERTILASPPKRGERNITPWLAILLLDDSAAAPAPPVERVTVADLLPPAEGGKLPTGTLGPDVSPNLDGGEALTDACQAVDIPAADFLAVAPAAADLPYLAHVREIDHSAKATPKPDLQDDWYSIVIGNRMVQPGAGARAYLVSLEGFASYLPGGEALPGDTTSVRLVVMSTWSFTDNGESFHFMSLVDGLDKRPLALAPARAPQTAAEQDAAAALAMGYTPLGHTTRQGEQAVSWYRGPLVPLAVEPEHVATWPASDAALRFDPGRGMLDVSYAAAWQLGRLLLLAATDVAQALFDWRRGNQTALLRLSARLALARRLPSLGIPPEREALLAPRPVVNEIAAFVTERLGPTLLDGGDHGLTLGDPSGLRRVRAKAPGLLGADELDELCAGDDALAAIARRIVGDGA